jgi:hypothetical protein
MTIGQSEDGGWNVEGYLRLIEAILAPLSPQARTEWMERTTPMTAAMLGVGQRWLETSDLPEGHVGGGRVHRFEYQAP